MNKLPLLLFGFLLGACAMLSAQSFDLTTGRLPVASLDGLWRFQTGDNPAWADSNFDDSKWSLLRSDQDWDGQGYKGYGGMAWYRFQITVPAGLDHVSLYLPQMNSSYEVYVDGSLVGTWGGMPPSMPHFGGESFNAFTLPATKHAPQKTQVALRLWNPRTHTTNTAGGPQSAGGLVGDTQQIQHQNDLDRADYFREMASFSILALLEALAGVGALLLFLLRRREPEYLWFSLAMLLRAVCDWMFVSLGTRAWNFQLWQIPFGIASAGSVFAVVAFYQQLLHPKRTWLLSAALASIVLERLLASAYLLSTSSGILLSVLIRNIFVADSLSFLFHLVLNAWVLSVVFTGARKGSLDARLLLAPVILKAAQLLFFDALAVVRTLGWRVMSDDINLTRTPFPIGPGVASQTLFLLAVFAILIFRFTRTRSQEERFAGEVQSAREVQQYLIPTQLPPTPGLRIESEYRPAREVGGDFFQVLPNVQDGSVLIVLGDVAGKGLQAGMLATLIVGAIRTAAAFTSDPLKILVLLNERLQGRGLVTCLALTIGRDGESVLVNAGHLPPYLNGRELPMEGALPLGALLGVDFPVHRFQLVEDDALMLMSDGIAEAQDAKGQLFGFERIEALLRERATAAELATAAQHFGQEDDITVLTMARMMSGGAPIPLGTPG